MSTFNTTNFHSEQPDRCPTQLIQDQEAIGPADEALLDSRLTLDDLQAYSEQYVRRPLSDRFDGLPF